MTNRSEIFSIRTILPVGLGVAIGIAVGAVALANVPAVKAPVAPAAAEQTSAIKPLSAAKGISFARANRDGERCFSAQQIRTAETFCTH